MPLADDFDGFLVDLDGVVWIGREPVAGAPEALVRLMEAGKGIVFVTNNPGRPPAAYAERLRALGVPADEEHVVTAGTVAAELAAQRAGDGSGSAFVIGAPALRELVAGAGLRPVAGEEARRADVVVVSGHRGFDYEELLTAKLALDGGAALVATSRDPTMPMPGGEWPGTGAVLAAVETASGRLAEIAGKPERHLFAMALERLSGPSAGQGADAGGLRGARVAMVGDRLTSDIEGGRRAGLATILVLSGVTSPEQAEQAEARPDHVLPDLAALSR